MATKGGVLMWSFDDMHIGQMALGGSSLLTRELERPAGVTNNDWYTFAGATARLINRIVVSRPSTTP
ncbi:hypothetical protein [Sinorhizobium meliloti]|uniref:hypothetical protein n=1 Tax=Rhizobium meliloti TaxID=382 RepID=UPI000FD71406|nr:hypothetical protein [Sinorhizobium meliloti]RVI59947.1 hypothetical protein CN189_23805 [Sinorhizobium meliloti]